MFEAFPTADFCCCKCLFWLIEDWVLVSSHLWSVSVFFLENHCSNLLSPAALHTGNRCLCLDPRHARRTSVSKCQPIPNPFPFNEGRAALNAIYQKHVNQLPCYTYISSACDWYYASLDWNAHLSSKLPSVDAKMEAPFHSTAIDSWRQGDWYCASRLHSPSMWCRGTCIHRAIWFR